MLPQMFDEERVKELRTRPANELNNEELWTAHGAWAITCIQRVIKHHRTARVRVEDLLGVAFEWLQYSAKHYRADGGASFTNFSCNFMMAKLHVAIWKEYKGPRPKPANPETPDPGGSVSSLCQAEETLNKKSHDSAQSSAKKLVHLVTEAKEVEELGNYNNLSTPADRMVDLLRLMTKVEQRIDELLKDPNPQNRKLGERMEAVMLNGESEAEYVVRSDLTRQAINYSVHDGRYHLQHLLGYPVLNAVKTRRRQAWSRANADLVNQPDKPMETAPRCLTREQIRKRKKNAAARARRAQQREEQRAAHG